MDKRKWQSIVPRRKTDQLAVVFVITELFVEIYFELFIILPELYPTPTVAMYLHVCLGFYLLFNTLGNLILAIVVDTSTGTEILPAVLHPGWQYCYTCMQNSPPRAVHCFMCGKCVMKREHHCVFLGKCVGIRNHRYYMMTVFYLAVGSLYANFMNMDYAWNLLGGFSLKTGLAMIAPILGWMFGVTESISFFISFQCGTCILSCFMFFTLLIFHVMLIYRGQVTYEWRHGIKEYDLGWKHNFLEVFGARWYLVWLFPTISSPLPCDGITYKKRNENIKDI
ncbi:probable palmitoyltransferase ZDHHC24 [Antedon mediterranea]|uniref:probable palmitoyltransferase ZDHHC24 n=1 Tax=Antedon mediterranea TaxID=105859 RepID=UPI003AF7DBE4